MAFFDKERWWQHEKEWRLLATLPQYKCCVDYLLECAKKMADSVNNDEFNIRDYEFHLSLVKCSHNDYFVEIYQSKRNEILMVFELMNQIESSRDYAIQLHQEMAETINLRNSNKVIKLLNKNDEYNVARMIEICKL